MEVRVSDFTLQDIHIGMFASFSKKINRANVKAYASTVGDISPLHVDAEYGYQTDFKKNLVHGMFTASLFSTVVGVLLPGRNALLSGIHLDFVRPIQIGSRVTVTASVISILQQENAFKSRLLAYVDGEICARGEVLVHVRSDVSGGKEDTTVNLNDVWIGDPNDLKTVLITGATGLVGRELCMRLAREGWQIGIHYHRNESQAQELFEAIANDGGKGCLVQGDLNGSMEKVQKIAASCRNQLGPIGALIHAACPSFRPSGWFEKENLGELYGVQVQGLRSLLPEVLPDMMRAQYGFILVINSDAITPPFPSGWQNYIAVKQALQGLVGSLASEYEGSGLTCGSILAGALRGDSSIIKDINWTSSGNIRKRWPVGLSPRTLLLPRTLADLIFEIISGRNEFANGSVVVIKSDSDSEMRVRDLLSKVSHKLDEPEIPDRSADKEKQDNAISSTVPTEKKDPFYDRLNSLFHRVLNLDKDITVKEAVLGEFPDWDSLNHLKLLMEVEEEFGLSLEGTEELFSFQRILNAVRSVKEKE